MTPWASKLKPSQFAGRITGESSVMRNVVLAVVLHGSVVVLFVVFLLWNAGKFDRHGTLAEAPPVAAHSSGVLPVVPVLRAAVSYGPGDALYDTQLAEFRAGRLSCVGGVFSRRVLREGREAYVAIETDRGPIPCP